MEEWEKHLNEQELNVYAQYFQATKSAGSNFITGQDAVRFFARSGIPNEILSDIWETSDVYNVGYLTPETFSIALKLIACAQHGRDVRDPILSTVVPLPRFEGFDIAAMLQNKTGGATGTTADTYTEVISASDRDKYLNLFARQPLEEGCLSAETAIRVFARSRLSNDILAQIWNLADVRKAGNLNQTEFVIAMHYIAKLMDGSIQHLPSHLPSSVYRSASGSIQSSPLLRRASVMHSPVSPPHSLGPRYSPIRASVRPAAAAAASATAPRPSQLQRTGSIDSLGNAAFGPIIAQDHQHGSWDVSAQEKEQYDAFFDKIDTNQRGYIEGPEAVEFFNNSKLPPSDLARIWDMADMEEKGRLTKDEFAIAMHLINARLRGMPLPRTLPKTLVPPAPLGMPHVSTPQQLPPQQIQQSQQSQQLQAADGDLLGEFDNSEELTTVTNEVNQLQYQITTLNAALTNTRAEKANSEKALQKQQNEASAWREQVEQIGVQLSSEAQRLAQLRKEINAEEPSWTQIRWSHDRAVQERDALLEQIEKTKHSLELGSTEGDRLRRRVHGVQAETKQLVQQLDHLRTVVDAQQQAISQPAEPNTDPFAVPDNQNLSAEEKLTFDDAFSSSTPASPSPSDFDALFGAHDKPSKRPPPPPPQRRPTQHHQQQTPQVSQQQSVAGHTKKARAPPPPPRAKSFRHPEITQDTRGERVVVADAGTSAAATAAHGDQSASAPSTSTSLTTTSSFVSSPETQENHPVAVEPDTAGRDAVPVHVPSLTSTEFPPDNAQPDEESQIDQKRHEAVHAKKETLSGETVEQPSVQEPPAVEEAEQSGPSRTSEEVDGPTIAEHDDTGSTAAAGQSVTAHHEETKQDGASASDSTTERGSDAVVEQEENVAEQEENVAPKEKAFTSSNDRDKHEDKGESVPDVSDVSDTVLEEQASSEEKKPLESTHTEVSPTSKDQGGLTQDEQEAQTLHEEEHNGKTRGVSDPDRDEELSPTEPHVIHIAAASQQSVETSAPEDSLQSTAPITDVAMLDQAAVEANEKEPPHAERSGDTIPGADIMSTATEASQIRGESEAAQEMAISSGKPQQHEQQELRKELPDKEETQEEQQEEKEEENKQVEEEKEAKEENDKHDRAQTSGPEEEGDPERFASDAKEKNKGQHQQEEGIAPMNEISGSTNDPSDIVAPLGDIKDKGFSDTGEGDSFEMVSSTNSPVPENKENMDEFDEAFDADFARHKEPLSHGSKEDKRKDKEDKVEGEEDEDDDFDAAFAGQLTEARMMRSEADPIAANANATTAATAPTSADAFDGAFLKDATRTQNTSHKMSWASDFGGFNFDFEDGKKPSPSADEDWDSIFGVPTAAHDGKSTQATDEAGAPEHVGFQDAFSSRSSNNNNSASKEQEAALARPSVVADPELFSGDIRGHGPVDDLIAMGFDRKAAKEALERYDQDLEKATNFLLDTPQSS
ncbi:hypothetical protein BCR43DRAFT_480607 [Syncephalastrum racemosum]|uniref:Cytoskeletal adapter protein sagA n=1 Tax=Syncephalastrum racemosum TaxID=13706 RepID=A0A1X2H0J0_SYNRA|nr:hypothetical protein BCR43DRAFT_480607 [Syncephalastrum racemosum]